MLRPVDGHRLDQALTYEGGGYAVHPALMRIDPGAGVAGEVEPHVMGVLLACDGKRSLRSLIDEAAEQIDGDTAERYLPTMRRLVELGLVEAVSRPDV